MKEERIFESIADIDEKYVAEARTKTAKKKQSVWIKWVAAAACFALVVAAGIPIINNFTQGQDKEIVDSVLMIEYDNAYYEVIENNPDFLERKGIETDISNAVAGSHITYLKKEKPEAERYIVSKEETNMELLEYAPANQKAVRILRDGDKYYAAVFCNYLINDTESLPFDEVFMVYGISKAEDIKSIVSVKTDNEYKANGNAVTDSDLINSFYNEIITLERFSEDEFDKTQFTYDDENKADEYHGQFADDRNDIMIETADGLRFIISYYPTYDWVNASLTQTYYKLSPVLEAWIETNLK